MYKLLFTSIRKKLNNSTNTIVSPHASHDDEEDERDTCTSPSTRHPPVHLQISHYNGHFNYIPTHYDSTISDDIIQDVATNTDKRIHIPKLGYSQYNIVQNCLESTIINDDKKIILNDPIYPMYSYVDDDVVIGTCSARIHTNAYTVLDYIFSTDDKIKKRLFNQRNGNNGFTKVVSFENKYNRIVHRITKAPDTINVTSDGKIYARDNTTNNTYDELSYISKANNNPSSIESFQKELCYVDDNGHIVVASLPVRDDGIRSTLEVRNGSNLAHIHPTIVYILKFGEIENTCTLEMRISIRTNDASRIKRNSKISPTWFNSFMNVSTSIVRINSLVNDQTLIDMNEVKKCNEFIKMYLLLVRDVYERYHRSGSIDRQFEKLFIKNIHKHNKCTDIELIRLGISQKYKRFKWTRMIDSMNHTINKYSCLDDYKNGNIWVKGETVIDTSAITAMSYIWNITSSDKIEHHVLKHGNRHIVVNSESNSHSQTVSRIISPPFNLRKRFMNTTYVWAIDEKTHVISIAYIDTHEPTVPPGAILSKVCGLWEFKPLTNNIIHRKLHFITVLIYQKY